MQLQSQLQHIFSFFVLFIWYGGQKWCRSAGGQSLNSKTLQNFGLRCIPSRNGRYMDAINPCVLLFFCACVCESVLSSMVPFGSTYGRKWFTGDEILTALRPQPFTAENSLKRKRLITPDYYLLYLPLRKQPGPRRERGGERRVNSRKQSDIFRHAEGLKLKWPQDLTSHDWLL